MPRKLTSAEEIFLGAIFKEAPDHFRSVVDELTCSKRSATKDSARIPDSYIGRYFEEEKGWFAGYFDFRYNEDKKSIFIVELTKEPLTFNNTVKKMGNLPNGYVANPYKYDARHDLRESKTVIAPFDILRAVCDKKDKFGKMFDDVGLVLSSSSHPKDSNVGKAIDFRPGDLVWLYKGFHSARSLLVRPGLTL